MQWLAWLSAHAFNSILRTTENISAARASNSQNLRGVKRRVRRGTGEGLPTSHTRSCTPKMGRLFTSTATKSPRSLVRMKLTKPSGEIRSSWVRSKNRKIAAPTRFPRRHACYMGQGYIGAPRQRQHQYVGGREKPKKGVFDRFHRQFCSFSQGRFTDLPHQRRRGIPLG
jgi:hypothetical protein